MVWFIPVCSACFWQNADRHRYLDWLYVQGRTSDRSLYRISDNPTKTHTATATSTKTKVLRARTLQIQIWPASSRMLIDIDISTSYMYKDGPLMGLCIEFLTTRQRRIQPQQLAPRQGFSECERYKFEFVRRRRNSAA